MPLLFFLQCTILLLVLKLVLPLLLLPILLLLLLLLLLLQLLYYLYYSYNSTAINMYIRTILLSLPLSQNEALTRLCSLGCSVWIYCLCSACSLSRGRARVIYENWKKEGAPDSTQALQQKKTRATSKKKLMRKRVG